MNERDLLKALDGFANRLLSNLAAFFFLGFMSWAVFVVASPFLGFALYNAVGDTFGAFLGWTIVALPWVILFGFIFIAPPGGYGPRR